MGGLGDWTPEEEQQVFRELDQISRANNNYEVQATESLSDYFAEIMLAAPTLDPSVAYPMALAVEQNAISLEDAQNFSVEVAQSETVRAMNELAESEESGNFFTNFLSGYYDKLKSTTRAGFGMVDFIWQGGTSLWSRAVMEPFVRRNQADPRAGVSGVQLPTTAWNDVKSFLETTQIGAASLNPQASTGNGFFIEGEVSEIQEQAALRYRGGFIYPEEAEIPEDSASVNRDVRGVTLGRGLGLLGGRPGDTTYNTISGTVDAGWALAAPTGFGALIKGGKMAVGAADQAISSRNIYRTKVGLTDAVTPMVRNDRVAGWLAGSTGQRIVDDVVKNVNDFSSARKLLPNADINSWQKLVEAKDHIRATEALNDILGTDVLDIRDINVNSFSDVRQKLLGNATARSLGSASRNLGFEAAFSKRPEGSRIVLGFASDLEKTANLKNLEDYLTIMRIDPIVRVNMVEKLANAMLTDYGDMRNTIVAIRNVFGDAYESKGLPRELLNMVFTKSQDDTVDLHKYNIIEGTDGSGALYELAAQDIIGYADDGTEIIGRQSGATGFAKPEARQYSVELPDPESVYRAFGNFNWLWSKYGISQKTGKYIKNPNLPEKFVKLYGQQRAPLMVFDFLNNRLFKRFVLAQPAYAVRIAGEGLLRQTSTVGLKSGIQHPMETIMTALMMKRKGLLTGELFDMADTYKFTEDMAAYIRDAAPRLVGAIEDHGTRELLSSRSGVWSKAQKLDPEYNTGVMSEIQRLSQDVLYREIIKGEGTQAIVELAQNGDKRIIQGLKDFQSMMTNQLIGPNGQRATPRIFDSEGTLDVAQTLLYLDKYFVNRIKHVSGGDQRILEIIANGDDAGRFTGSADETFYAFQSIDESLSLAAGYGTYSDEFAEVISDIRTTNSNAFPDIVRVPINPVVVPKTGLDKATEQFVSAADRGLRFLFSELLTKPDAWLNRSVVWRMNFYDAIDELLPQLDVGEASKLIENIRTAYVSDLREQASLLRNAKTRPDGRFVVEGFKRSMDDATRVSRLQRIEAKIAKKQVNVPRSWMENYVGGADLLKRIEDLATGAVEATGTRTVEQIQAFARAHAGEQTMRTLYDVSNAPNIGRTMQVASPFMNAWVEGLTKGTKLLVTNPKVTKNYGLTYQGLQSADPDNNGRGFIYTHPQTGEQVYEYPLNTTTGMLIAGALGFVAGSPFGAVPATAVAAGAAFLGRRGAEEIKYFNDLGVGLTQTVPVRSLNMNFHYSPGVGPVIQVALNQLLNANVIPSSDDIARALLPYGSQDLVAIPPAYRRIAGAIRNNPDFMTELAQAQLEAGSALLATSKYDRNDPASMEKWRNDYEKLAQIMVLSRGVNHLLGPGRPRTELTVPTAFQGKVTIEDIEYVVENGEISTMLLSQAMNEMYRRDPDMAPIEFVATFGDMSYGYLVGMTQAQISGLEASQEFYDWTVKNKDVVDALPELYPWFIGNITNQYDSYVYRRQRDIGERELRPSPEARIEAAEVLIGNRLYRFAAASFGPNPSDAEKEALREYKISLEEQYPGFRRQTIEVGRVEAEIDRIISAANQPVLDGNSAAETIRMYAAAREDVLAAANGRRVAAGNLPVTDNILSGKANADLRSYLFLYGQSLAVQNPDFERVWADVLFNEVDFEG